MEQTKNRLYLTTKQLEKALKTLEEVLSKKPFNLFFRDAAIQRFEYTFELTWKLLKLHAEREGLAAPSPRAAFLAGHRLGYFKDLNIWFAFLKARNLTSHTYDEKIARRVFRSVRKFPKLCRALIDDIEDILLARWARVRLKKKKRSSQK